MPMSILQSKPLSDASSRSRSSVRFAPRTKTYLVLSSKDMFEEEIASTWTTEQDSKRNQADIVETIKTMRRTSSSRTKHDEDDGFCVRGLEHMQSSGILEQRKINKESVIDAVLDEQDRQWDANVYDETKIAAASTAKSKSAVQKAATAGRSDAAHSHRMNGNGMSIQSSPRQNYYSLSPCLERSLDGSNSAFDVKKIQSIQECDAHEGHSLARFDPAQREFF